MGLGREMTEAELTKLRAVAAGGCKLYASQPDNHTCDDLPRSDEEACSPCLARRRLAAAGHKAYVYVFDRAAQGWVAR